MNEKLNVVLLLADEHSVRAVGAYGPSLAETPGIDALAMESCLFENAYCNSPVCVPSRLSFLSGRYASKIGAWGNLAEPPEGVPSIATILTENGYRTTAIGKMHFVGDDRYWGFESRPYGDLFGCGHQPDPIDSAPNLQLHPAGPAEIREEDMQETIVTELGIKQLEAFAQEDDPFFVCLSYNRPHFPLRPPPRLWEKYYPARADLPLLPPEHPHELHPWMRHHQRFYRVDALSSEVTRQGRAAYHACVEFVDEQVVKVLAAIERLGLRESTVVIYMSDHGEMNGEHGMWLKSNFYEEAVRVPLIVRHPRANPGGRRIAEIVELVDVVPTILDCAGIRDDDTLDGASLIPAILDGRRPSKEQAISEYYSHSALGPMRMIRRGHWKYCWYADATPSLFNLYDDPNEFHDLAGDGTVASMVMKELDELMRVGWDELLARSNFRYRPNMRFADVHEVSRSPNQFVDPDGTIRDAETFYGDVVWAAPTQLQRTLGQVSGELAE